MWEPPELTLGRAGHAGRPSLLRSPGKGLNHQLSWDEQQGVEGGRRRKGKKSMHVSRVGNLFSTLEEGIYRKERREMKGCEHISAIFFCVPFLD